MLYNNLQFHDKMNSKVDVCNQSMFAINNRLVYYTITNTESWSLSRTLDEVSYDLMLVWVTERMVK